MKMNKTMKTYVVWAKKFPKLATIVGDNAYVISVYIKRPLQEVEAMIAKTKEMLV